jgi:hypothetical protein
MAQSCIPLPTLGFLLSLELLAPQVPEVMSADRKPQTLDAFARYVQATESRIHKELARPGAFLYLEGLPEPRRSQALARVKRGEIYVERLTMLDASGREIKVPDGIIHHWMGAVFIPGANLRATLELMQDYNHHQDIYKPEVVRSGLVRRDGNDFKIYYRLRKKKLITVTLNTEYGAHYFPVDATHCYSHSVATRIAEVADADKPSEHEKPIGHDSGFLWGLNSYWRFEEKDGGVYMEWEFVALTRDVPMVLAWFIRPLIIGIPKETLLMTLNSTRSALEARPQTSK